MPEVVKGLERTGELLCVSGEQIVYIIDPNNPDSLEVIGEYALDTTINSMVCDDRYAYIATNQNIHIVDLSDPQQPELIDTLMGGNDLRVYGNRAFVRDRYRVNQYDISDRGDPRHLGEYFFGAYDPAGPDFEVFNGWLCYIHYYSWGPHQESFSVNLEMQDISGQDPPREGRTVDLDYNRHCELITMQNGIAFIRIGGILAVWDMRSPDQMQELFRMRTSGLPHDIALADPLLVLADETNIGIYNASDFLSAPSTDFILPPSSFILLEAYPNPFNSTTTVRFTLPQAGQVSLTVYDIMGRRVRDLTPTGWFEAGENNIMLNAQNLSSGSYILNMESGYSKSSRMITVEK